ncbi:MAG: G5 domain-containing protein [Clostridia bacterium]|nr:G5 domain-containing protein [Clostridia bacterium]
MFKTSGLLSKQLGKIVTAMLIITTLVTVSILFSASTVEKTVNIYADDNVTITGTKATTVEGVLEEAEIKLSTLDMVVPDQSTPVCAGMDIKVYRAVNVAIVTQDKAITKILSARNVGEALKKAGIEPGLYDLVIPDAGSEVYDGMIITVKKATSLKLNIHGTAYEISTQAETVGTLFESMGITISEDERINVALTDAITEGMNIDIIKLGQNYVDVIEDIPYGTDIKYTDELERGDSRKACDGLLGKQTVTYLVSYENGVEVSREVTGKMVIEEPVNEVYEYGTATFVVTSRGERIRAKKTLQVTATAYDLSYESCGKNPGDRGYGITASGMPAQYGVIAVDRSVIPLGTRLYVEAVDGSWSYGYCVAGDTGGGIRGNRIDLFYNSRQEAINFGRRAAIVYVLD